MFELEVLSWPAEGPWEAAVASLPLTRYEGLGLLRAVVGGLAPKGRLFLNLNRHLAEDWPALQAFLEHSALRLEAREPDFSRYPMTEAVSQPLIRHLQRFDFPRSWLQALARVPFFYADLLEYTRSS